MSASGPEHGWYPDPNGSGGERYWDGGAWTRNWRPRPAPLENGPRSDWRRLSGNVQTLIIAGIIAVVLVVIVVVVALNRNRSSRVDAGSPSQADSTSAPAAWIASVCRRGSYHLSGGSQLPNATSASWCQSKVAGTGVSFYTYDSSFLMNNDLQFGAGSYATYTDRTGMVWLVRSFASPASVLAPLSQFGFTVHDK